MEFCRISSDVILGKGVLIHAFVNLYGCIIGDGTRIGAFVEIQKGAKIGTNCKISSHSFICEGVDIRDNTFIGHNVTFINDKYPSAVNSEEKPQSEKDWSVVPTLVKEGVAIGSGSTIMCGVTVGAKVLIGAGSVVTKDIPDNEIWAGNPAKFIRRIAR